MKKIGPFVAVLALLCLQQGEPSETQIRTAFESALNNPLHAVLIDASGEGTGMLLHGETAQLRSLRKLGCVQVPPSAYVCEFFVELRVDGGTVRRSISGYFLDGPGALTFAREVRA